MPAPNSFWKPAARHWLGARVRVVFNRDARLRFGRGCGSWGHPLDREKTMPRFLSRFTPLLLDIEPFAAGIAGALLLFVIWLFAA